MTDKPELTPMDRLRSISPESAKTYMEHRKAIMEHPARQQRPMTSLLGGRTVKGSREIGRPDRRPGSPSCSS